mmetsp:Transcript_33980/g.71467  ORF Transcript_33980/g.71467 Transcript_33980/m.71467 type:complete len:428 (-) Transcript_33980:7-1290(-)
MSSMRAYRKAASKISPKLSPSSLSKIGNDLEQILTNAPSSAFSIPESVRADAFIVPNADGTNSNPYAQGGEPLQPLNPGAVVRPIGTSRRVFLLNPSLTPTEIDGLAYRIRTLASGTGIAAVVVANPLEDQECNGDMTENTTCLTSFVEDGGVDTRIKHYRTAGGPYGNKQSNVIKSLLHENFGDGLGVPHVSSGYDAGQIYDMGMQDDAARLERELLAPLTSLSKAVRGSYDVTIDSSASKVPLLSLPHGLVTDAGYALLMGSYVLATHSTSFRILNPLRGLAFDPIGLSYLLPRMGWEFAQPSREHSIACAFILALTGYEANAEDMVATGLATHYVGGPYKLNMLERALSNLNSYENQPLYPAPKKLYGRENERKIDRNDEYRNVAVGNVVQYVSEYDAAGANEYGVSMADDLDDETGKGKRTED